MLANEVLPGPVVSTRARAGECQILEMQRTEESLEIARLRWRYKDFTSAALERSGKNSDGERPAVRSRLLVEMCDGAGRGPPG